MYIFLIHVKFLDIYMITFQVLWPASVWKLSLQTTFLMITSIFVYLLGNHSTSDVHGCSSQHFELGNQFSSYFCAQAGCNVSVRNISCLWNFDGLCIDWRGIKPQKSEQITYIIIDIIKRAGSQREREGMGLCIQEKDFFSSFHLIICLWRVICYFAQTESAVHWRLLFLIFI